MILGLSNAGFTAFHVAVSLIAIVAGVVVVAKMLAGEGAPRWTALYLLTTLVTSVTGFFFPSQGLMPSHVFGVLSLIALVPAAAALYVFRLADSPARGGGSMWSASWSRFISMPSWPLFKRS